MCDSESTSIPVNPRTNRPVGYAFVDLQKAEDADKAIENLSGTEILDRKVSVQLARKPDEAGKTEGATAERKRSTGRGRGGRGRGRGGRAAGGRAPKSGDATEQDAVVEPTEVLPLTDKTNEVNQQPTTAGKPREPRQPKQRGPPEDGIPSTTKVMVANLPYDLTEEKVREAHSLLVISMLTTVAAQGTIRRLQARLCQDRPPTNPTIHDQEAPGPKRAPKGPRLWLRYPGV